MLIETSLTPAPWVESLSSVKSLGSQRRTIANMGELHALRGETLSQYFTPLSVVESIWRIMDPVLSGAHCSIMDNSTGSGRMFSFADPARHSLYGCDVHGESVQALGQALNSAGYICDFVQSGMETCRFSGIHVALINPPFSITLDSPAIEKFECNTHGKYGPGSSAVSHAYAVAQALDAASFVCAVLPRDFAHGLQLDEAYRPRLLAVIDLPAGSFRAEGTMVRTSLAVWDSHETSTVTYHDLSDGVIPQLDFSKGVTSRAPRLRRFGISEDKPVITRAVTGDRSVRVCHNGKKILLGFSCGLTEAKVLNGLLVGDARCNPDSEYRQPRSLPYSGSALFSIDTYLIQENPVSAFESYFIAAIERAGGVPVVAPGLREFVAKSARKMEIHRVSLRHVVYNEAGTVSASGKAIAQKIIITDPKKWGAPVIKNKSEVGFVRDGSKITVDCGNGRSWTTDDQVFLRDFKIVTEAGQAGSWSVKFPGRVHAFPELAAPIARRMQELGIDWLNDYQKHDVIEMMISPYGAIGALDMGLGKARMALALCLLSSSKHNLICVEPHLVDEMVAEIKKLNLEALCFQVITKASDTRTLKKINIISYARLRTSIYGARNSYGKALRHRFGLVIADEGHLLRNQETEQSRALRDLSPARRIVLTGTPIANYPRNSLPLAMWVFGSSTAANPYGLQKHYLEPRLITSASFAMRGADKFREDFTQEEWVTNSYAEEMTEGAKREIPRVKNLNLYRNWISCLIKRRTRIEPEVCAHVKIPVPTYHVHEVEFDSAHRDFYLEVAYHFCEEFKRHQAEKKNNNLIALLARIGAVEAALNIPHHGGKRVNQYLGGTTSKHRATINLAQRFAAEGKKTIIFCHSPHAGRKLVDLLEEIGLETVLLCGEVTQKDRTRMLRDEFRLGSAQVLVATKGVARTGLNIPEASRVIFFDRSWTSSVEDQAMARVLRPQQVDSVEVHYVHTIGSIDEYQAQMVAHKKDAASAALDWLTPSLADQEFLHMDQILGKFVHDMGIRSCDITKGQAFRAA